MMQVVIANRLRNGFVAFLDRDGGWATYLEDARVGSTEAESDEMLTIALRAAAENLVIDPQLIDVVSDGGALTPVKIREAIRAKGPTNRTDLGKQAER